MSSNETSHSQTAPEEEIDLGELLHTLWFYKWYIALITVLFTAGGTLYALTATPVYQADAMLEVSKNQNQVLGNLSDVLSGSPGGSTADTEIQLIQSRQILGKTVADLHLDTVVVPKTSFLDKFSSQNKHAALTVTQFNVAPHWQNQAFEITVHNPQTYRLTTPDGQSYNGRTGETLAVKNGFSLTVQQIQAPFGQSFSLSKLTQGKAIEDLRSNLGVSAKGKNIPIIGLTLTGTKPEKIRQILNSVVQNYIAQNREKDIQTAQNGLKFINEELPRLHAELQEAENELNEYRSKNKSLDIPTEAKSTLDSMNKLDMQIVDLKTEESVLAEVYTQDHPAYKAVRDKLKVLTDTKERLNKQIKQMPETQQEIIRLTRNVEISQKVYLQLLQKQQELGILQASSQGSVRLIDQAVTAEKPIKPKKAMIVALSAMVGLLASMMAFLLKSMLHKGISSEEEVEAIGTAILGSIPASAKQAKQDAALKKTRKGKKDGVRSTYLLSVKEPTDITVEALRALRTNLFFTGLDSANPIVMISGSSPEVGKSFISINLAVLMAQSGKKVLLVDADMRKGYLHHLFENTNNLKGLPNILSGGKPADYRKIIQHTNVDNLEFISRGQDIRNPAELLLGEGLRAFFAWASKEYDYIVLDTPPVLAVTDAAVIGQYAGQTLLVSRFGQTSVSELEESIARFTNSNIKVAGVVLNGIERTAKNAYKKYGYGYGKYGYYGNDKNQNKS